MSPPEQAVETIQQITVVPTILNVVCETTGMGFAAVAQVSEERWIACQVLDNIHFGLPAGGELDVKSTICAEVRHVRGEVVIDHVDEDPLYSKHHTPALYGFQSYISVPIILPDGEFFGTLCAIDPHPRKLKETPAVGMCRLFAQLIAFHVDARRRLEESQASLTASEAALLAANTDGELREQFIAVLGHDLRNPLASIDAGIAMLAKQEGNPRKEQVLRIMGESVHRMNGLISNLMDFARGRLGGGIGLQLVKGQSIQPALRQVIDEISASHPGSRIEGHFDLPRAVTADHGRIAQMFSNLLANAISHGDVEKPVKVDARIAEGQFRLSVTNQGEAISPAARERLFRPFSRGEVRPSQQGLGLGLYISSQIAVAHGGHIEVASDENETRFTFVMPA